MHNKKHNPSHVFHTACKGGKSNACEVQEISKLYHCDNLHGYTSYYSSTKECDKETGWFVIVSLLSWKFLAKLLQERLYCQGHQGSSKKGSLCNRREAARHIKHGR